MSTVGRTCLTRTDSRKLEDLVQQHRKELEDGRWTYQTFSEHATRQMKRPITPSNVKGACHVMEINLRPKRKTECNGELERRIDDLRRVLRDVAKQLSIAMKCIDLEPEQEFWTAKDWLELPEEEDEERND